MHFWLCQAACDCQAYRLWAITVIWIQLFGFTASVSGSLLCTYTICAEVSSPCQEEREWTLLGNFFLICVVGSHPASPKMKLWRPHLLSTGTILTCLCFCVKSRQRLILISFLHFTSVTLSKSWNSRDAQEWHPSHFFYITSIWHATPQPASGEICLQCICRYLQ